MHPHLVEVFDRLDRARGALGDAVERVPPAARQERPGPGRWSTAEVLEHLAIAERNFSARVATAIEAARAAGLGAEMGARAPLPEAIEARMADRVNTRTAPDPVRPTGSVDAASAWGLLEEGHRRLRTLVEAADGLALGQVTADHHSFGALTIYQWIELMAAHEGRHAEQILELAAALRRD
jgi:hypothetical protein